MTAVAPTEDEKQRAIDFYDKNGYYIVTSPGQQEIVDELVKDGLLHKADKSWFIREFEPNNIYVHVSVDCPAKMPCALYKMVVKLPKFYKDEIVFVEVGEVDSGREVEVYAKVLRAISEDRYEVSLFGNNTCLYVSEKQIRRTFDMLDNRW